MKRDPAITYKIMSSVKSKNTRPELALRKALWKKNYRYRVNYKDLPGRPDIVFTKYKIAVFCDGDFWHGHNWAIRGMSSLEEELKTYSEYWRTKILRNIERDHENNVELKSLGWTVVRLWESDIKTNVDSCVETICEVIFEKQMQEYEVDGCWEIDDMLE